MFLRFREGFPDLAWIEIPDPHIRKTHIRSSEHKVGEDDGGVGLRGVDTISITDPCLFVTTADDKDDRSTIARMDRPQASQGIFTLDNPDPGRLEVLGRWSYASCLENHVQLVIRDRKAVK